MLVVEAVDRAGAGRGTALRTTTAMALVLLLGCAACVDSKQAPAPDASAGSPDRAGSPADPGALMCEATLPVPYAGVAAIPAQDTSAPGPYAWKNVVIKGGGFVSGIVMSPVLPGLVFARTDVGGAYRYDPSARRWIPLTDWVGKSNSNLMGIESIAADPVDPNRVYMAAGAYLTAGNGAILSSTDMGQTWAVHNLGAPMGGNANGRSMGERLAIDPNLTSIIYFGSRTTGLWKSADSAETWHRDGTFPTDGTSNNGSGLSFVVFDARSGSPGSPTPAIYIGVGALDNGTGLYHSTDAGETWEPVGGQPAPTGMMPHHAVLDGCGNLYLAYNNGPGPNSITGGAVWRYTMASGAWADVSPAASGGGGFGGIAADAAHPGTLIVTTMDNWGAPAIYRTTNGGARWVPIMGSAAQHDVAGAQYLWWHSKSLPAAGWMGDVEIDPFNPARVLYITGQGIWSSDNATAADAGHPTLWSFDDDGLEETVALDLASPPAGAPLLTAVGDIAGFRHDDLDVSPAAGMFSDPVFSNTASLDFAEGNPAIVARVGTNNSTAGSKARGAYSLDGGTTWTPFGGALASSAQSGSIAVSADGQAFLWAPQGAAPSYSHTDATSTLGVTWTVSTGPAAGVRVAADRVNPLKFYASGRNGMYVSTDGGATFGPAAASVTGRPRPVFGIEGDVWVATSNALLHSVDSAATFVRLPQVSGATAVGFGMPAPGQSYPAVYLAGSVGGIWGLYRSDDVGATWQRIDDPNHQFGSINCLSGDPRQYGRVYLGTGGRGIIYGDIRPI